MDAICAAKTAAAANAPGCQQQPALRAPPPPPGRPQRAAAGAWTAGAAVVDARVEAEALHAVRLGLELGQHGVSAAGRRHKTAGLVRWPAPALSPSVCLARSNPLCPCWRLLDQGQKKSPWLDLRAKKSSIAEPLLRASALARRCGLLESPLDREPRCAMLRPARPLSSDRQTIAMRFKGRGAREGTVLPGHVTGR